MNKTTLQDDLAKTLAELSKQRGKSRQADKALAEAQQALDDYMEARKKGFKRADKL